MNYGKKLFDKLIQITKTKPVSMAFEFPNKALINFLYKNYNIGNPIYQINNIITYYSFNDQNFNKYLDDRHRPIDINKMENDIDNYKKWSLLDKDYKIFNSDYSYKNIFPLKFKNNKINRMDIKNIENNYFNRLYNNIYRNKNVDKNNMRYSFGFKNQKINSNNNSFNNNNYSSDYILNEQDENNKINNNNIHKNGKSNPINIKKYDKKNIYGKKSNIIDNLNPDNRKYTNELNNDKNEYYSKFNDYYINRDGIKINYNYENKNSIRENYYNHINDEDMYFKNMLNKQIDNHIKLSHNIENLNNRILENKNEISLKNNYYFKDIYYHKNKSFATLYDSIQNKLQEEKDYNNYKKYQITKEYSNL